MSSYSQGRCLHTQYAWKGHAETNVVTVHQTPMNSEDLRPAALWPNFWATRHDDTHATPSIADDVTQSIQTSPYTYIVHTRAQTSVLCPHTKTSVKLMKMNGISRNLHQDRSDRTNQIWINVIYSRFETDTLTFRMETTEYVNLIWKHRYNTSTHCYMYIYLRI